MKCKRHLRTGHCQGTLETVWRDSKGLTEESKCLFYSLLGTKDVIGSICRRQFKCGPNGGIPPFPNFFKGLKVRIWLLKEGIMW